MKLSDSRACSCSYDVLFGGTIGLMRIGGRGIDWRFESGKQIKIKLPQR
jgi:hypothetical protein